MIKKFVFRTQIPQTSIPVRSPVVLVLIVGSLLAPAALASAISSYAFVNDDATLVIRNRRIRLYGIYVPPTGRTCRTYIQPVKCASRAALALDFKIQGFVSCHPIVRHRDRSLTARCYLDDEDLSAYLLSQGWAVALPSAPFEYRVLERIAKHRHLGIWGIHADSVTSN